MKKPTVRIYTGNGEFIDRDMNDAELAQYETDQENDKAKKTEIEANAAQRQAILDKLGLTADEAQLLLG
jgi:hypothetical protein